MSTSLQTSLKVTASLCWVLVAAGMCSKVFVQYRRSGDEDDSCTLLWCSYTGHAQVRLCCGKW